MADIINTTDFFNYGMLMPGRSFNAPDYRFGMNGQEKDDEISGVSGANYTADNWEYDSRLGKRWNIEPVVKPWESPYATFSNNPIFNSDPTGAASVPSDENSTSAVGENGECYACGNNIASANSTSNAAASQVKAGNEIKLGELPKAKDTQNFLEGAIKTVKTGETITSEELKNFINPSETKEGEKQLSDAFSKIASFQIQKSDDKSITLTVNLKDKKDASFKETIVTPYGNLRITVQQGTTITISKSTSGSIIIQANNISASFKYIPLPIESTTLKISGNTLDKLQVIGITVLKEQPLFLPEKFQKK